DPLECGAFPPLSLVSLSSPTAAAMLHRKVKPKKAAEKRRTPKRTETKESGVTPPHSKKHPVNTHCWIVARAPLAFLVEHAIYFPYEPRHLSRPPRAHHRRPGFHRQQPGPPPGRAGRAGHTRGQSDPRVRRQPLQHLGDRGQGAPQYLRRA